MKKEEKELVKEALRIYEYMENGFNRINGASVRITNLRSVGNKYYYTGTLIYSEEGQKSIYHDCYMDKKFIQEFIEENKIK